MIKADQFIEEFGGEKEGTLLTKVEYDILAGRLDAEEEARAAAVSAEAEARASADSALDTAIGAEAEARAGADAALDTAIGAEAEARASADSALDTAIGAEAEARTSADSALEGSIDKEAVSRADADAELLELIQAVAGTGGPLTAHDFGTETPTQQMLTEYACTDIWGAGGVFTYNAANPAASTYVIGGVTHTASEILNGKWVTNTYNDLDARWMLVNAADAAVPVFGWIYTGSFSVAQATSTSAGVMKLFNTVNGAAIDGSVTQAAVKTAIANEAQTRAADDADLEGEIYDEAVSRANSDAELLELIQAVAGTGGPLTAPDFGTETPTQQMLTEYACNDLWGTGGVFTYNADDPANSTYTIDGVTHKASEILNGKWVTNTYNGLDARWMLVNAADAVVPVFGWIYTGSFSVGQATPTSAGVMKLFNTVDGSATDGSVTQAAVKAAISDEAQTRASEDAVLDAKIYDEETARASGDNQILAELDTESAARKDADTALSDRIDALGSGGAIDTKANKILGLAAIQWNSGTPIPADSPFKLGFNTKIPDFSSVQPGNYYKMTITSTVYFFAGCLEDGTKGVGFVNTDGSAALIYDANKKTWLIQDGLFDLSIFTVPIPNVVTLVGTPDVSNYDFTGETDIKIYSEVTDLPDVVKMIDTETDERTAADIALTEAIVASGEYTYMVDSDQKLLDWANNVTTDGQDYTVVYIAEGNWKLSKAMDGGTADNPVAFIDLQVTGTKEVRGASGGTLGFTDTGSGNVCTAFRNLDGNNLNYRITRVTVVADNVQFAFFNCGTLLNCIANADYKGCKGLIFCEATDHSFINCNSLMSCNGVFFDGCTNILNTDVNFSHTATGIGFNNCSKLMNCVAYCEKLVDDYAPSYSGTAFNNCTNLINCQGTVWVTARSWETVVAIYGYKGCRNVINCTAYVQLSPVENYEAYGFAASFRLQNNRPSQSMTASSVYNSCYASGDTSAPVADTAAGGWNSSTPDADVVTVTNSTASFADVTPNNDDVKSTSSMINL